MLEIPAMINPSGAASGRFCCLRCRRGMIKREIHGKRSSMQPARRGSARRVLGYPPAIPLRVSGRAKALLLSVLLCVPCAWIATAIADNPSVPDTVRYVVSPGTMLGLHLTQTPTHTFHEMMDQLGRFATVALLTNMLFYGMLTFGFATVTSAFRRSIK